MRRRFWLLAVACSPMTVGCQTVCPSPISAPGSPNLPVVERKLAPPDLSAVTEDPSTPIPLPHDPYYRLTADECQQLACTHSSIANLIDATAHDHSGKQHVVQTTAKASVAAVRQLTATYLSLEVRNRTAGTALELYFQLQEAELLSDVLARSIAEVDADVGAANKLRDNGFKEPPELFALRKQQLELRTDHARLQAGIRKLNTELKSLLSFEATPGTLLPVDTIQVAAQTLDATQAVAIGMQNRAELQLLRQLIGCVNPQTADAIRQSLISLAPPLRAVAVASNRIAPGLLVLFPSLGNPEAMAVRSQLQALLASREKEITKDITAAVDEWNSQRDLVALLGRQAKLDRTHVDELQIKQRNGLPVAAELSKARLELLKAESDQIREAVKWKLVDVKTRQLMGILCICTTTN